MNSSLYPKSLIYFKHFPHEHWQEICNESVCVQSLKLSLRVQPQCIPTLRKQQCLSESHLKDKKGQTKEPNSLCHIYRSATKRKQSIGIILFHSTLKHHHIHLNYQSSQCPKAALHLPVGPVTLGSSSSLYCKALTAVSAQ